MDLNNKDQDGNTLLYYTAMMNNDLLMIFLLVQGADPNIPCRGGIVPLHVAAEKGHLLILKALLEQRAEPNKQGKTACKTFIIRISNYKYDNYWLKYHLFDANNFMRIGFKIWIRNDVPKYQN